MKGAEYLLFGGQTRKTHQPKRGRAYWSDSLHLRTYTEQGDALSQLIHRLPAFGRAVACALRASPGGVLIVHGVGFAPDPSLAGWEVWWGVVGWLTWGFVWCGGVSPRFCRGDI